MSRPGSSAPRVAVAGAGVAGGRVLREAQEGLVERAKGRDCVHPRPVLAEDRGTAAGLVGAFRGPVAYRGEPLPLESTVVGQLVEQARAGQQGGLRPRVKTKGKGDRKPLGVCGWLTTGVVGAELLGTAVVALGIQFGAAPPHTRVGLTPVGAMED